MRNHKVLFWDLDQAGLRNQLEAILGRTEVECKFQELSTGSAGQVRSGSLAEKPDVVFILSRGASREKMAFCLKQLKDQHVQSPVIVVFPLSSASEANDLLQAGFTDVLSNPLCDVEVLASFWRYLEWAQSQDASIGKLKGRLGLSGFIGESTSLMAEIQKIPKYAILQNTVFITGERGTGKGVAARAIHHLSLRSALPYKTINCGNISPDLLESQLFGHEIGAFTGAVRASQGLFRSTDGGTVFMDELEGLTTTLQVKLLDLLQEKHFFPVGSTELCTVDVRIIAATNMKVEQAVKEGRIRADLYDRLNVLRLQLPALRERLGDIPLLARHFLAECVKEGGRVTGFSPGAMVILQASIWPGNVRELKNLVVRVAATSRGPNITAEEMSSQEGVFVSSPESLKTRRAKSAWKFDDEAVKTALLNSHGNITKAAQSESMDVRTFRQLLRDHGISPQP